eukprot:gnl/Chilomastix_caulleri/4952.p1 GENE.gnl/Chilomastix_caulleri/4952~~gnl/Chilomastix_caulleri/4952.p1  ORF type:complete len:81 (+),score=13.07 gnl/Chilomastix_caulleri/4952:161-403(+)
MLKKDKSLVAKIIIELFRLLPSRDGEKASGITQEIYEIIDHLAQAEANSEFLNNLVFHSSKLLLSDNKMIVESIIFLYQI